MIGWFLCVPVFLALLVAAVSAIVFSAVQGNNRDSYEIYKTPKR